MPLKCDDCPSTEDVRHAVLRNRVTDHEVHSGAWCLECRERLAEDCIVDTHGPA